VPFQLFPDETPEQGVRRIIMEEIEGIVHQLTVQPDGRDSAVHQSRKRFKRIRAAIRLVRGVLPEDLYHTRNRFFRDQSRLLSPARDSAVLLETVDKLVDHFRDELPEEPFPTVRQFLTERYAEISAALYQTGVMADVAAALQAQQPSIENLPIPDHGFAQYAPGMQKVYRRGRRRMAAAYDPPYDPHTFHDWRKRVKYLWHQCEILQLIWPEYMQMWGEALHGLSDLLGDAHDLVVLAEILQEAAVLPAAEMTLLVELITNRCTQLEKMAWSLGERLYAERPATFINRIAGYWHTWQEDSPALTAFFTARQSMLPVMISAAELAAAWSCSRDQVRELLRQGDLPGIKVGNHWVIPADQLPETRPQMIGK